MSDDVQSNSKIVVQFLFSRAATVRKTELAEKLGMTRPTLDKIEQGRSTLTIDHLLAFCKLVGVKPTDLFGECEKNANWKT